MLKEERQTWILNKLHSSGKVVVSHLAGELKVSEDTIRRDLLDLDQKGQLKRVFGGAGESFRVPPLAGHQLL